jgi:hypothetical protein
LGIATKQASEETGRFKLSEEVGNKWGDAIKNMLGGLKRPEGKLNSESVQSSPAGHNRFSKLKYSSPSTEGCDSGTLEDRTSTPTRTSNLVADEELMYKSPLSTVSARRSRRGAQPFGSEVKQVNGSGLNPQAKEFFPTLSSQQKVHELNLQAVLNPEAEEFSPQTSVHEKPSKAFVNKLPPFPNFSNAVDSSTHKPPHGGHKGQKNVAASKESKEVSQLEAQVAESSDGPDHSVTATRTGTSAATSNTSSSSSPTMIDSSRPEMSTT